MNRSFALNPLRPAIAAGCGVVAQVMGLPMSQGHDGSGLWIARADHETFFDIQRPEVASV